MNSENENKVVQAAILFLLVKINGDYLVFFCGCLIISVGAQAPEPLSCQAIQDVDEFVSSSEKIRKNVTFLLVSGASAANGCHQK